MATVTDTSVIITWFTGSATRTDTYGFPLPVATGTVLQLGQWDTTTLTLVPGTLKTVFSDDTATPYHYAEVTGLDPNTAYGYVATSNGQQAQQSSMQFPVGVGGSLDYPGTFTTLATHYDCWGDVFPYPSQGLQHYEAGGLRIMGLDTTMLDAAGGTMDREPIRTQLALAWAQRTRHEYCALYPHYMLGTIADRNHTVVRDPSGLTPLSRPSRR